MDALTAFGTNLCEFFLGRSTDATTGVKVCGIMGNSLHELKQLWLFGGQVLLIWRCFLKGIAESH